jgi:DNA-binding beta-propeller fold protein YncE
LKLGELERRGAGNEPIGVVFDGANIWVANEGSNTISKLLAAAQSKAD